MYSFKIISFFFILFAIICSINCNEHDNFLSTFRVKSLVRIVNNNNNHEGKSFNDNVALEVEETCNQVEGTSKMVVISEDGGRSELFLRSRENLYLEARYASNGTLVDCNIEQTRPVRGYFGIFSLVHELTKAFKDNNKLSVDHFIGPSALLYMFRGELESTNWRQVSNGNETTSNATSRRRLIVNPKRLEFSLNDSANNKVTFKQSDFLIARSPLLSQLATFMMYTDNKNGNTFIVDFLTIDNELNMNTLQADLFKLPTAFACIEEPKGANSLHGVSFSLKEGWSKKLSLSKNRFSATFHALSSYPGGVHLMFDMSRSLFRFDINGKSRNVFDIKNKLIYHMPNEPAALADTEVDVMDSLNRKFGPNVRNDECTIVSSETIIAFKLFVEMFRGQPTSYDRWRFLVGNTDLMIYLGQATYKDHLIAHEFELQYLDSKDLPVLFSILMQKSNWNLEEESNLLVAKLWLEANEKCTKLNSDLPDCLSPVILGFKLDLIDVKSKFIRESEEIQLSQFMWDFNDEGLVELPFKAFDLHRCPIEKLYLSMEVKWFEELTNVPNICEHRSDIDEFVCNELVDYLAIYANSDVSVVELERQSYPGTKLAKYSIELAYKPQVAISFSPSKERVMKYNMKSQLIDEANGVRKLFECLTYASQFGNAGTVLFSPTKGCLLYANSEHHKTEENDDEENSYALYERFNEELEGFDKNGTSKFKLFMADRLDELNKELRDHLSVENHYETCLEETTLVKNVHLQPIKLAPKEERSNVGGKRQTLLLKEGFRFVEKLNEANLSEVESRIQEDAASFVQCQTKCFDEPTCNSFAYCRYPEVSHETCQMSDVKLNEIRGLGTRQEELSKREIVTRDEGCEIHAKDYMLHFERMNPSQIRQEERLNNKWYLVARDMSELECAESCFSRSQESCLRFVHCAKADYSCFQWLPTKQAAINQSSIGNETLDESNMQACNAYAKKLISLYKRTISFENSSWISSNSNKRPIGTKVKYMSKEKCAERCTLDVECESFDSCYVMTKAKEPSKYLPNTFYRFDCVLLEDSLFDGEMYLRDRNETLSDANREEKSVEMEERWQCNHFERSDLQQRLTINQVRQIAQTLRGPADKTSTGSYITLLLCASLLGLGLGYGAKSLVLFMKQTQRT